MTAQSKLFNPSPAPSAFSSNSEWRRRRPPHGRRVNYVAVPMRVLHDRPKFIRKPSTAVLVRAPAEPTALDLTEPTALDLTEPTVEWIDLIEPERIDLTATQPIDLTATEEMALK
jgi:hypothetical protein